MAKSENKEKTEQELRWEQLLEGFKKQNPAKYDARLKAGELEMPKDF